MPKDFFIVLIDNKWLFRYNILASRARSIKRWCCVFQTKKE